jgi:hypothetical protein
MVLSILFNLFISFVLTTNVYITGRLSSEKGTVSGKEIILKTGGKTIANAITKQDGSYEMTFLDTYAQSEPLKFYLVGKSKRDLVLLKTVATLESDTPVIDLVIPTKVSKY